MQTTNTPEKSTKSENINEYTLNRFVDAISLALTKWDAWKYSTYALIHFCDEQPQVAVKESALIVTSLECHNNINLQPQSEGDGRQTFSTHWKLT